MSIERVPQENSKRSVFDPVLDQIDRVGRATMRFLAGAGRLFEFMALSILHVFTPPYFGKNILTQMINIGFYSLPLPRAHHRPRHQSFQRLGRVF